ncbi:hypothetical protein L2V80_05060 [Proteus mirabilis]|uniref:hypothetical protein n=1 Tax=Proteus mirabilis TaxID=584 RepID=UPI0022462F6E|nr:hypothetical protein [Proteus mirabilis]MCW9739050.1 hypothetical protein [Proteus mirabilis]
MSKIINDILNTGSDALDKISSPTSRAGYTVERAAKMLAAGVCPEAIAAQMNKNSAQGNTYTPEQVTGFGNLYEDCKTKVPVSREAATALINDATENSPNGSPAPATP